MCLLIIFNDINKNEKEPTRLFLSTLVLEPVLKDCPIGYKIGLSRQVVFDFGDWSNFKLKCGIYCQEHAVLEDILVSHTSGLKTNEYWMLYLTAV